MEAHITTGLIPVRFSGGTPSLRLAVSSFSENTFDLRYRVNWVQPEGRKTPLHEGVLMVGPQRTAAVTFNGIQGRTVEVNLNLPHPSLKPTVTLIGTFAADAAETILAFVSPDDFTLFELAGETRGKRRRTQRVSTANAPVSTRTLKGRSARRRSRRIERRVGS